VPSFKEHQSNVLPLAVVIGLATAVVGFDNGIEIMTALVFGGASFLLVLIGNALPDIDSHSSIPRRMLGVCGGIGLIFAYVAGAGVIARYVDQYLGGPLVGMAVIAVLVFLSTFIIPPILSAAGSAFDSLLTHRGVTHTIAFAVALGAVVYYTSDTSLAQFQLSAENEKSMSIFVALAIAVGALKHLSDDEV
jgi:hypothetical protein